jgi:DNA invertase Pin-like site-specific DNA recombinase
MMQRQGGRACLNRLKLGDVQHLVIAKLDRLGRNVRDALSVLEFLQQQNITLHITDFGGETISTQAHPHSTAGRSGMGGRGDPGPHH